MSHGGGGTLGLKTGFWVEDAISLGIGGGGMVGSKNGDSFWAIFSLVWGGAGINGGGGGGSSMGRGGRTAEPGNSEDIRDKLLRRLRMVEMKGVEMKGAK